MALQVQDAVSGDIADFAVLDALEGVFAGSEPVKPLTVSAVDVST